MDISFETIPINCLLCHELQQDISMHLATVCMKDRPDVERAAEVKRAEASAHRWIRTGRIWDFGHISKMFPDRAHQVTLTKELLRRGFLVSNQPDMDPGEEAPLSLPKSPSADSPVTSHCQTRSIGSASAVSSSRHSIIHLAKNDVERIREDLQEGRTISNTDRTLYRYYCEAVLIYLHMQPPGAVEDFTDAEWVGRVTHGSRVIVRTVRANSVGMRVALSQSEEAILHQYYLSVRPHYVEAEKGCNKFFVSVSGDKVHSISQDMNHLHSMYKLGMATSQDVRRAVWSVAKKLQGQQKKIIDLYLTRSSGAVSNDELVEAAEILCTMTGTCVDEGTSATAVAESSTPRRSFSQFLDDFPVTLQGQPPSKRQRSVSRFYEQRSFYDKWRLNQYSLRRDYLLSHFNLRRPLASKVQRLIVREGWTSNCPKADEVVKMWKPPTKNMVETDPHVRHCVTEQAWTGLALKDFGPPKGFGVVATRHFASGDIVCDYHGNVIAASEGRQMMEGMQEEAGYLFFFKHGDKGLCIDAQTFPCSCHPLLNTFGRRINHSSKTANVKPFCCVMGDEEKPVILFKAIKDIHVDEELKFDYGVNRKSFRGEGLDLEWLGE